MIYSWTVTRCIIALAACTIEADKSYMKIKKSHSSDGRLAQPVECHNIQVQDSPNDNITEHSAICLEISEWKVIFCTAWRRSLQAYRFEIIYFPFVNCLRLSFLITASNFHQSRQHFLVYVLSINISQSIKLCYMIRSSQRLNYCLCTIVCLSSTHGKQTDVTGILEQLIGWIVLSTIFLLLIASFLTRLLHTDEHKILTDWTF